MDRQTFSTWLLEFCLEIHLFYICFIFSQDNVLRMSIDQIKENDFILKRKSRSRRYPAETKTDAEYDLAVLANTPAQAKYQLYSQEQAVGDIGLYVNTNEREFMCFKREEPIFTLSCRPQLDKFTSKSAAKSHLLKMMLTYALRRRGLQWIGYWLFEILIYPIK